MDIMTGKPPLLSPVVPTNSTSPFLMGLQVGIALGTMGLTNPLQSMRLASPFQGWPGIHSGDIGDSFAQQSPLEIGKPVPLTGFSPGMMPMSSPGDFVERALPKMLRLTPDVHMNRPLETTSSAEMGRGGGKT